MASREARRIRDRLAGKDKKDDKGVKKHSALTIPSVIVLGLVLIGLMWWGATDRAGSANDVTFGAYDGRPIVWSSGNFFARKVAQVMEAANPSGDKMDAESAVRFLLPYMIFHTAILAEADKNGLTVSDTEVEDYIRRIGADANYNKADAIERHDQFQVYKEELLEINMLQSLILQSFENASLENNAAAMGKIEKKFKYVQWKYDDYPMQEIAKFAAENKDLFRTIKLSRIATKTENEAKDAYAKITGHQSTFDDQLKALTKTDNDNSAGLDWQAYYSLENIIGSKETTDKIFSLKQGEISEVVSFGSQWFIYRCDKEAVPADLSAEKTIKDIKSYILEFQKGRVESYFENEGKKFLEKANTAGFDRAAAGAGLRAYETGYFPINNNALAFLKQIPDMKDATTPIANAQTESIFFKELFALKKGGFSKPILLRDMVIVSESIDERTPTQADLDKIKSDFKNLKDKDFLNFYFIIADRLYTRGLPQINMGQFMYTLDPIQFHQFLQQGMIQNPQQIQYNLYALQIDQQEFYQRFVDLDKMGPRADREAKINEGFAAYRKLFASNQ